MRLWLTLTAALLAAPAMAQDNALQPSPTWEDLRGAVMDLDSDPPQDATVLDLDAFDPAPMTRPSCPSV